MPKRDYLGEIIEKRKRLSGSNRRWDEISDRVDRLRNVLELLDLLEVGSELIRLVEAAEDADWQLRNFTVTHSSTQFEVARYIPIGFVACIEGYFRLAYADLINYGPPFRDNAAKFDNIKFSIETAVSLQSRSVTLGDFVAHQLSTNNLDDINGNMSTLINIDFLAMFRKTRPELERQHYLIPTDNNEMTNRKLAAITRLFELRHMYAHEADPHLDTPDILASIRGGAESAMEFLFVSDIIIGELLLILDRRMSHA